MVILAAVFLAHATNVTLDALWHDDGNWYRNASEGVSFRFGGWDKPAPLAKIRHDHYAFSMVEVGLIPTRLVYVGMMALTSLLLWILYRKHFGLGRWMAVVPACIPSMLYGIPIPVGLNAAYAVPSLLATVATMLTLWMTSTCRAYTAAWFAGLACAVALHFATVGLASAGVILSPVALLFAMLAFWPRIRELLAVLTPLAALTAWSAYVYLQGGHREPTHIPLHTIVQRIESFLDHASIIALPGAGAWIASALLGTLGLLALVFARRVFQRVPWAAPKEGDRWKSLALLWSGWALVTALPYILLSPSFRPHDYAFSFAYAWAGAQGFGLLTLIVLLASMATPWMRRPRAAGVVACLLLLLAAVQKNLQDRTDPTRQGLETASEFIRKQLDPERLPQNAQVVIVDPPGTVSHPGISMVNTGYLRYLLGRDDIRGLVGPSIFPNNPFERVVEWTVRMKNLRPELPILAFREAGGVLAPIDFLLIVRAAGANEAFDAPRFEWALLRISDGERPPSAVRSGKGLDTLDAFLEDSGIDPEDVLFGPDLSRERLLTAETARELGFDPDGTPIGRYENGLELVECRLSTEAGSTHVEYLLRATREFDATERINYEVGSMPQALDLAYATLLVPGDYLLVRSEVETETMTPPALRLSGVVFPRRDIRFDPSADER